MPLSTYELRTSIAVSDIQNAVAFYEGRLGLRPLESGPSAHIAGGSRVYGSVRYDQFEHDPKGITARAGGGRIAWFQDPDGNTFALEADV